MPTWEQSPLKRFSIPLSIASVFPVLAALTYFCLATWILLGSHLHEDAYILLTYVENLAQNHGITYYDGGPPAEGSTDFLWMISLAFARWAGLDTAFAAALLNAAGIGVVCFVTIKTFPKNLEGMPAVVLGLGISLLVVLSPLTSAGVGGFSSPLYAAFTVLLFKAFLDGKHMCLPLVGLLVGLIRPDGVIIGVTYALMGLSAQWHGPNRQRYLLQLGLAGVAGIAYFIWRSDYFGYLLPLPLYVKSTGSELLAGITTNFYWFINNIFLFCLAMTVFFHRTLDRKQIGLALLPFLLLFVSLSFAQQTQNVAFRFQAPITGVLIVLSGMSVSRWLAKVTKKRELVVVVATVWLMLPFYSISLATNIRVQRAPEYINYLPHHLADSDSLDTSTTIALTEAGRMAYWMGGKKFDLVGLNTAYPAIHGLTVDYLRRLQPDLIFIHTAHTLSSWPPRAEPFFEVTIDSIRQQAKHTGDWAHEFDPVERAPLVVYDYLEKAENEYAIVMARYYGQYAHLFAIRKDGAVKFTRFMDALKKSFDPKYRMSYWEMKKPEK